MDEPDILYVVGFYVRPAWRGRGYGTRLLELVKAELPTLGAEGLLLTVAPDNDAALALYRRAGFVRDQFIADFYGPGEHRWSCATGVTMWARVQAPRRRMPVGRA